MMDVRGAPRLTTRPLFPNMITAVPSSFMGSNSTTTVLAATRRLALAMLFALLGLAAPSLVHAQTTYLSEDFEGGLPSSNFSATGNGVSWQINSTYSYAGSKAAWFQSNAGAGTANGYLQSRTIDLSGSTKPLLSFWHIAALERFITGMSLWLVLTLTVRRAALAESFCLAARL